MRMLTFASLSDVRPSSGGAALEEVSSRPKEWVIKLDEQGRSLSG